MMRKIDYNDYWNKNRKKNIPPLDREKIALKFLGKIIKNDFKILDAGCGNGKFIKLMKEKFPEAEIKGVDYSKNEVAECKKHGLDVSQADLEEKTKFKSNYFDIIYSGEVIEHLYNPDAFLVEINRILKKNGYFILTTPNLAAWYNRIFLLFGMQPLFLEPSTKSKLVGSGILKRFKKDNHPVGHVRIFNYNAIKDLLEMNGFEIRKVRGSIFDTGLPKPLLLLDRIFKIYPKLSSLFVIVARKI